MSYIGSPPKQSFTSGLLDRFTSTTGTTVTLTHDIASENDIVVFVNFVKQDSTTYSVGGTGNKTLTLGGTLVSSDIVEVHYLNIVGQTVAPSSGSVGSSQLTTGAVTGAKLNTDVISAQTELASAPASTDELLVSDAGVLKRVDVSLVGGANTPAFEATLTADTTITSGVNTAVVFPSEDFDTASAYNASDGKFTVPSGQGGKYFIFCHLILNAGSPAELSFAQINLYKNGSQVRNTHTNFSNNNIRRYGFNFTTVENLSASDYLQIYAYADDSSGNPDLYNDTTNPNFFGAYKIIE